MNRYLIVWDTQANGNRYFMNALNQVRIYNKRNTQLINVLKQGISGVRVLCLDKGERVSDVLENTNHYGYYVIRTERYI